MEKGRALVVGLGNPGLEYARSRHNVGFRVVEMLSRRHGIPLRTRRGKATIGEGRVGTGEDGRPVLLAKPRTYMNLSGEAVGPLVRNGDIRLSDLLVVCDDLDLPLGKIRLRPGGSAGGHNGLRSIIAALDTPEFPRLRVGIGRPEEAGEEPIEHVLGPFRPEELPVAGAAIERAAQAVLCFLEEGIDQAMNRFNG
ncbi:MAG: aminoacyl-tRNA hydrolase [Chloroflexi bacterium]|nr:aminoacyl-tRNA hydrolase [Chloroflexota bacterium]